MTRSDGAAAQSGRGAAKREAGAGGMAGLRVAGSRAAGRLDETLGLLKNRDVVVPLPSPEGRLRVGPWISRCPPETVRLAQREQHRMPHPTPPRCAGREAEASRQARQRGAAKRREAACSGPENSAARKNATAPGPKRYRRRPFLRINPHTIAHEYSLCIIAPAHDFAHAHYSSALREYPYLGLNRFLAFTGRPPKPAGAASSSRGRLQAPTSRHGARHAAQPPMFTGGLRPCAGRPSTAAGSSRRPRSPRPPSPRPSCAAPMPPASCRSASGTTGSPEPTTPPSPSSMNGRRRSGSRSRSTTSPRRGTRTS